MHQLKTKDSYTSKGIPKREVHSTGPIRRSAKRQEKKKPEYIRFTCPSKYCKQKMSTLCPRCHMAALDTDKSGLKLHCSYCSHSTSGLLCRCGYHLRPSSVQKAQRRLRRVQERCIGSEYLFIAGIAFATLCFLAL